MSRQGRTPGVTWLLRGLLPNRAADPGAQQEQQNLDRQLAQLRHRAQEFDERDAALRRQGDELTVRLTQLLDAKERFGAVVKGFNGAVRFNTTLSAISHSIGVADDET